MRHHGDSGRSRRGKDFWKAHRVQYVHDVRPLLSKRVTDYGSAAEPGTAHEIRLGRLECKHPDIIDLVRVRVARRMRGAGENRALMPLAAQLGREIEG